jgi:hypothetical protein
MQARAAKQVLFLLNFFSAASFYLLQFQPTNITQFACHI